MSFRRYVDNRLAVIAGAAFFDCRYHLLPARSLDDDHIAPKDGGPPATFRHIGNLVIRSNHRSGRPEMLLVSVKICFEITSTLEVCPRRTFRAGGLCQLHEFLSGRILCRRGDARGGNHRQSEKESQQIVSHTVGNDGIALTACQTRRILNLRQPIAIGFRPNSVLNLLIFLQKRGGDGTDGTGGNRALVHGKNRRDAGGTAADERFVGDI